MTYFNEDILIETGFDELIDRLNNPDVSTRRLALIELADAGFVEHQVILIAALSDENEAIRCEAAQLLAGWEDAIVVDALALRLLDSAESVRLAAAQSLFELKTSTAGLRLIALLTHDEAFVVANSLHAVRELRLPEAKPAALAALNHANAEVRREAAGVLGWLKDSEALPELAKLVLHDSDTEVRRIAAGALGFAGDDTVLAPLLAALADAEWQVRDEAASTLGKLKFKAAVAALITILDEDIWQISLKAARALGKIGDIQALPSLIASLAHPAGNLRKEAAIALGEIADIGAKEALIVASNDPDPEVRKAANLALSRLATP